MKSTTFALGLIAALVSTATAGTNATCGVYQISDGQPQWVPCPSTTPTATCNVYQISDGQPQWKPCSTTPPPSPPPSSCVVYQISDGQPQYVPCSASSSVPLLTGHTTTTPAPVLNTSYVSPSPTHASTTFTGAAAALAQPELAAGGLFGLVVALGYLVM